MIDVHHPVVQFYRKHIPGAKLEKNLLTAACPFCSREQDQPIGKICVFLNREGFFFGYFRCLNNCSSAGFPLWFAKLLKLDPSEVPGHEPDKEPYSQQVSYPVQNINDEATGYQERLTDTILSRFSMASVNTEVLEELKIGFNGRYLTYPYFQSDGNCYSIRCVHPDKPEDCFWHGNEAFFAEKHHLYNIQDLERCENGALFICEGEENLLTLKALGFPGVAVPNYQSLELLDPLQFAYVKTIFLIVSNDPESETVARYVASRIGYKVRLISWPSDVDRNYNLWQLAVEKGKNFRSTILSMLQSSRAFSPFTNPKKEGNHFFERLFLEQGEEYKGLRSGFNKLDKALGGIHGINVIGGAPKVGKSCFMIQIATEMAARNIPVLYYDFENGRQRIYHRTLCRLSRLMSEQLREGKFSLEERIQYDTSCTDLKKMLFSFRVVNDRKVNPELMRRHIDFIRHETRSEFTVVVIDSLHKLPFKDFSERRTGIDAWLRQIESIRDELHVSFLIISELTRGEKGGYKETPHMGLFKGSGDIEYSADNAMVLTPDWEQMDTLDHKRRRNKLWLVASREHSPGLVAEYILDYPYWGFTEQS